jgi:hypothetical protein
MKKKMIIASVVCAVFAALGLYSLYGYINNIKPFDISFPIGFGLFALISA